MTITVQRISISGVSLIKGKILTVQEEKVSEFLGREYNFDVWKSSPQGQVLFKSVAHAGEPVPDFTLPTLDGGEVTLSGLKGKPVVIEFGSIT